MGSTVVPGRADPGVCRNRGRTDTGHPQRQKAGRQPEDRMHTVYDGRRQEARPGATGSALLSSEYGLKTPGCLKTAPLGTAPMRISSASAACAMQAPQGQDIGTGGPRRARLRGGGQRGHSGARPDQRHRPGPRTANTARTTTGLRRPLMSSCRARPGSATRRRGCRPFAPVLALRGIGTRDGARLSRLSTSRVRHRRRQRDGRRSGREWLPRRRGGAGAGWSGTRDRGSAGHPSAPGFRPADNRVLGQREETGRSSASGQPPPKRRESVAEVDCNGQLPLGS